MYSDGNHYHHAYKHLIIISTNIIWCMYVCISTTATTPFGQYRVQRWKPRPPCIQTSSNNIYQYHMVYVCMYHDHHYNPIWTISCTAMETTTTISTASLHQLQGSESPTGRRSSTAGLTERSSGTPIATPTLLHRPHQHVAAVCCKNRRFGKGSVMSFFA